MLKLLCLALFGGLIYRLVARREAFGSVCVLIVVIVTGSLLALVARIELWPFSPYPMFAEVQLSEMSRTRMYGVTDEVQPREVPLVGAFTAPLGEPDLTVALYRIGRTAPRSLVPAVEDCLRRYELQRAAGKHDGPRLQGVRLYTIRWELKREIPIAPVPLERRRIVEVRLDPKER